MGNSLSLPLPSQCRIQSSAFNQSNISSFSTSSVHGENSFSRLNNMAENVRPSYFQNYSSATEIPQSSTSSHPFPQPNASSASRTQTAPTQRHHNPGQNSTLKTGQTGAGFNGTVVTPQLDPRLNGAVGTTQTGPSFSGAASASRIGAGLHGAMGTHHSVSRQNTKRQTAFSPQAMAEIMDIPERIVKQISDLIKSRGIELSSSVLMDWCDQYKGGSLILPELPGSRLSSYHSDLTSDGESSSSGMSDFADDKASLQSLGSTDSQEDDDFDEVDSGLRQGHQNGVPQASAGQDEVDSHPVFEPVPSQARNVRSTPSDSKDSLKAAATGCAASDPLSIPSDSGIGMSLSEASAIEEERSERNVQTDAEREGPPRSRSPLHDSGRTQVTRNERGAQKMSEEERQKWMIQCKLQVLQKEFEILDASRKCSECKLKARDTTFLPCGHFMMCKECSEPVYTCPSCAKPIQATAQTFLS